MENIEKFNLCAAHILGKLYGHFPVPIVLDAHEIVRELDGAITDDVENKLNANKFVANTIKWLTETGYLLTWSRSSPAGNRYVLSPKALEAMNASLSALSGNQEQDSSTTIGQRLSEITKDTGGKVVEEAQKQSITQLVGWVIGLAKTIAVSS